MSACNCSSTFDINFAPINIGANGIWEGYAATIEVQFEDPADISSDLFSATIKNSLGATVDTLTVGSGINIVGTDLLQIVIQTPVTDAAGDYTLTIIWTPVSSGAAQPFSYGIINVIAVP